MCLRLLKGSLFDDYNCNYGLSSLCKTEATNTTIDTYKTISTATISAQITSLVSTIASTVPQIINVFPHYVRDVGNTTITLIASYLNIEMNYSCLFDSIEVDAFIVYYNDSYFKLNCVCPYMESKNIIFNLKSQIETNEFDKESLQIDLNDQKSILNQTESYNSKLEQNLIEVTFFKITIVKNQKY